MAKTLIGRYVAAEPTSGTRRDLMRQHQAVTVRCVRSTSACGERLRADLSLESEKHQELPSNHARSVSWLHAHPTLQRALTTTRAKHSLNYFLASTAASAHALQE